MLNLNVERDAIGEPEDGFPGFQRFNFREQKILFPVHSLQGLLQAELGPTDRFQLPFLPTVS